MELLNVYDNNGKLLNKTMARHDKNFAENENIKVVTVWIKCKDKYLIQKTSAQKGGRYAVTGGHVQAGKTSKEQVCIEVEEELGITIKQEQLKFLGQTLENHKFTDVFLLVDDRFDLRKFTLQTEEVEAVFWLSTAQIDELIEQEVFRKSSQDQYELFIKKSQ